MLTNMLVLLALAGLAVLFFWLARRALRLRRPVARWALAALAALPALLLALVAAAIGYGYATFYLPRSTPALAALDTAATPERIARGTHLALTTCVACHAADGRLPLSGGIDLSSHSPLPIGTLVPPNLTPGGPLAEWSDAEIAQAIRNGRHKNGRGLLMPTESLRNLSDADVGALVAFLRSQPPVVNATPPLTPSPLLALLFGSGLVELGPAPVLGSVAAPPKQPTAEYGAYVVGYQDCRTCHGDNLSGSSGGLGPPAPSARGFAHAWTKEQFIQTLRTGVDPSGHAIQEPMPWQMIGQMDDVELAALYEYLRSSQ